MALAGCATATRTAVVDLQVGMSREDLRLHFGEPLRIEPAASGGENWYYRFVAWQTRPTQDSGISNEYGHLAPYASSGLDVSKGTEESPIHISSGGYVIEPLPKGKVVHK